MHKLSQIQELEKFLENILPYSCWSLRHVHRLAIGSSVQNSFNSEVRARGQPEKSLVLKNQRTERVTWLA